ncbi:MAG: 50S ribosomal protein L24, partial [Candidatus Heimdallarchaeota archaeon]|nr:50S ribosomal protein L24 [Candidatus Heimdallarchaeota archaeon]
MRTKSKKPNKQRYYQYNIPKHENHKLLSASVSKKLKQDKGLKSLPIREGDEVLIVRGSHKGKSGKVNKTDPVKSRIYVDGLGSKKTDAQEIAIPIHPSNVVIQKIYGKDKYRREQLIARRIADKSKMEEVLSILEEEAALEEELEEDVIDFAEDGDDDDLLLDDDDLLLDDDDLLIDDETSLEPPTVDVPETVEVVEEPAAKKPAKKAAKKPAKKAAKKPAKKAAKKP